MKKITFLMLFLTITAFGQNIKKTELDNNTLKNALFIKEAKEWGGPYKDQFEDNFEKNKKVYIFELEYKGEAFFREGIEKDVAKGKDAALFGNMHRFTTSFYVPYNLFDNETKLDMLERKYVVYEKEGVKYLHYKDFKPVVRKGQEYIINPDIPEYIKLRIYELEF